MSFLHLDSDNKRFALPGDIWHEQSNHDYRWQGSGLFAFDLKQEGADEFELSLSGDILAESPNAQKHYPAHGGQGRSVIHDDAVFYLHGNDVFSNTWGSWHNQQGPQ